MDELRTATGRIFRTNYVVTCPQPQMLFIRILLGEEDTIESIEAVFKNPTETSVITYAGHNYEGYVKCKGVTNEGNNVVKVRLRK